MLQWIKNFSIPLIYLSFLLLWLYYAIFSASYLALLGFVFLLVCLFIQFPWKSAGKVLIICGIFGFWFVFQNWQQSQASQNLADSVERVRILPDTIKVNGDSLSFYFAEFQPWSILLTFVFSFLFDLTFLPLLSILFVLSFLYPVIQLNFIFEWLEGIIRLVSQVARRPLVFGQPNAWLLILLLISLALVYDLRKNIKGLTVLSLLITGLFFLTKYPLENEITMLDVGQGESIFLRDVTGKTILIDVGGKAESYKKIKKWQEKMTTSNAQRTLIPYLKSRGVAKIDQLILTNTDKEHVGDLSEMTKAFHVGEILVSKDSLKQKEFVAELQATQTKVRSMIVGENLPIFGSQLEVLSPRKMGDGGHDDTLVLYGKFLDKQFLFTGNLEEKGEKDLLKHYPDLKVNVLKASQHGNKKSSSPAFLEKLKPELTLISVGKSNRMKLPHQETLTRLEGINSKVYRTDQQGAIRFKGLDSWKIESVR